LTRWRGAKNSRREGGKAARSSAGYGVCGWLQKMSPPSPFGLPGRELRGIKGSSQQVHGIVLLGPLGSFGVRRLDAALDPLDDWRGAAPQPNIPSGVGTPLGLLGCLVGGRRRRRYPHPKDPKRRPTAALPNSPKDQAAIGNVGRVCQTVLSSLWAGGQKSSGAASARR
jgi:hypothetical protein